MGPTDPFPNFELRNPPYNTPELHNIGQCPDSEAEKFVKGPVEGLASKPNFLFPSASMLVLHLK